MKTRVLIVLIGWLAVTVCPGQMASPVVVEFFYEPGCSACRRVEVEVLPEVELRYGELVEVRQLSLDEEAQYLRLIQYMTRSGVDENAEVFMVVNGRDCLAGFQAIQSGLAGILDESVSQGLTPDLVPDVDEAPASRADRLQRRVRSFTLGGVVLGGLVDGLNPCALATLVFLLSVLAMAGLSGRDLLAVGGVFGLAAFLTYTALGFGLLGALHLLDEVHLFRLGLDTALVVLLVGLALVSLRDAWVFSSTSHGTRMILRLPSGLQQRLHHVVRSRLARRARLPAVFMVGVLVTGLESVCTGQVYAPTLVLVIRGGHNWAQALAYLLLYNVMFILPLIVTILLAAGGMKWNRAAEWSREHVVLGKVLLALFFLGLAALMFYLHGFDALVRQSS